MTMLNNKNRNKKFKSVISAGWHQGLSTKNILLNKLTAFVSTASIKHLSSFAKKNGSTKLKFQQAPGAVLIYSG